MQKVIQNIPSIFRFKIVSDVQIKLDNPAKCQSYPSLVQLVTVYMQSCIIINNIVIS